MVLERCKRKMLLGWRLVELPNRGKDAENSKKVERKGQGFDCK